MKDYFYKLNTKLLSRDSIAEYMDQKTKWMHIHGFDIVQVPESTFSQDELLVNLIKEFGGEALLLRLPPWKIYNFHRDIGRGVVINSIIEDFDCFTFYSDHIPNIAEEAFTEISEVYYQPGDMFLLNTQKPHGVYNRSQRRTVLSVSFEETVSYNKIKNYCIKHKC